MARLKQISIMAGVLALGATFAGASLAEANPVNPYQFLTPSPGIGMANWTGVLLPANTSGLPTATNVATLSAGRSESPWLTVTGSGALQFWTPSGGSTASRSLYTGGTELESGIKDSVGEAKHTLSATLEVLQLPRSNPEITVGQLRAGGSDGTNPFAMIDYTPGSLFVQMASGTSATPTVYPLLTGVAIGSAFSYSLEDNGDGTLTVSVSSGSQKNSYTIDVPSAVHGATGHFSAGDYVQNTASAGAGDGGVVDFTALSQN